MFGLQESAFTPAELDRFRHFQKLTFDILEEVSGTLREGETEKAVTKRIHKRVKLAGSEYYFHGPVALFGDRTSYPGNFRGTEALPPENRLKAGDPVILDCAP